MSPNTTSKRSPGALAGAAEAGHVTTKFQPDDTSPQRFRKPVEDIHVGSRHRKDLGDIKGLARNISEVGLLHPVVVTPDGELIAGARRLAACKHLGWEDVPITVVPLDEIVRGEAAENAFRKDFLPTEVHAIKKALEEVEKAKAKERQLASLKRGDKVPVSETFADGGRASDKIGAYLGVSGRQVEKIGAVMEAAEENPKEFGDLPAKMDKTGKVNGAYLRLRQAQDEQRIMSIKPVEGKCKTLVIDPPWDYGSLSLAGRAAPGYATMSHEELLALDVEGWAEENCHLYLWTTNNFMTRAVDLMKAWGFQHKTVLTWVKPRIGLGSYFRNSTEPVLFGVRGKLGTRADDIATHFEAPTAEHSAKPDAFYDIVRRASYPPYGEAFQREAREGLANLFEDKTDEVEKLTRLADPAGGAA